MRPLDRVLPRFDFREEHAVALELRPQDALTAVRAVRGEEAPLLRALFRLRGLATRGPVVDNMLPTGFQIVEDEPDRLVLTAIGRPWTVRGGMRRVEDFAAFDEPGWAKMALAFWADGDTLRTETRVLCTDAGARRRFRRYWLVVRPLSGLTRRSWLRAARRRATSAGRG